MIRLVVTLTLTLMALAAVAWWSAPGEAPHTGRPTWSPPADLPTEPPAGGRQLDAGSDLQAAIDQAAPGDVLLLAAGDYRGPVHIDRQLTLWGPREAVIRSSGVGTTVRVEADGTVLSGFTVNGSGGRFDLLDAAVRVEADGVRVAGLRIEEAVFGLLVEKSNRVVLYGNEVIGTGQEALGLRGDGIRLWETRDSVIEGNFVTRSRDLVVWYSADNRITGNFVESGRYGTHFMYSHRNLLEGNTYLDNVVGTFVMYSDDIDVIGNIFAGSAGAAGIGLGVKESGNLVVSRNHFVKNEMGVYLDTSPLQLDEQNVFEENHFRLGRVGVVFHSSPDRNTFRGNIFRDNETPVEVQGRGNALGVTWEGNYFDGYRGYDLDGDGIGDVPFELRSLSHDLVQGHADLAFFRHTPAMALCDVASQVVPLYEPKTVLVDLRPRMSPQLEDEVAP